MGILDIFFGKNRAEKGRKYMLDTSGLRPTSTMMDEEQYWDIIDDSLSNSKDQESQEKLIINELQKLSLEDIIGFRLRTDKLLYDTYNSEMWCAAYIMNGGCSDDSFEYFRCWLISRGKGAYQKAKKAPDSLITEVVAGYDYYDFESFWYVALVAFERLTGENLYDFIDYDKFTTIEGKYPDFEFTWEEDKPDTMKAICPQLFDKLFEQS
nr:DUF4240 domain-containing protein [uncultured Desulfobacter sp.]